jgi:hypothetical protein
MQQKPSLSPQAKAGVIAELLRNIRLVWLLLKDERVDRPRTGCIAGAGPIG